MIDVLRVVNTPLAPDFYQVYFLGCNGFILFFSPSIIYIQLSPIVLYHYVGID